MAYPNGNLQAQLILTSHSLPTPMSPQNPYSKQLFLLTESQKRVLTLFQQPQNTQLGKLQTIQKTDNTNISGFSNFNLHPVTLIGIASVLALVTFAGFFFLKRGRKKSVPDSAVLKHDKAFQKIIFLGNEVQKADHERFTGREFITYLRIKIGLVSSQENGLYESIKFLQVAISSKRHYDQVFVVETQFRGRKQQDFYQFVDDLIDQGILGEDFRKKIEAKLTATLPILLKDEGKNALKVYTSSLVELSYSPYGLELLSRFRRYEMSGYSVIRIINDLVDKFTRMDLIDSNILLPDIMLKIDVLNQLATIVDIPNVFVNPEGFREILHFIALEVKQQDTTRQFKRFISMIEQWRQIYQKIQDIRLFYNPKEYWLPKKFCLKIPGEDIFAKYKSLIPQILENQQDFIVFEYKDRNDFGMSTFF